ncbi:MAG: SLC13 family permease [Candidatus Bathyarchaeia archaeon]|nr:anion permease [Candidatus Bathyarchaeota archaeon]
MRDRQLIGFVIGVVALLVLLLLPPKEPLTPLGMRTLGLFLSTIIWWVTVGLDYPSFMCMALLTLIGIMPPQEVFAASIGSWVVSFLIGCFGISECLRATGVINRLAIWFLTRSFVVGHPWRLISMLLLACTLVSSFISSIATCIIFMAIVAPMLEALGYKKGEGSAAMVMMGIAWAATASSAITPIGFSGNIVVIEWIRRDLGQAVSFLQWVMFGTPTGLITWLMILCVLRYAVRPDMSRFTQINDEYIGEMRRKVGPMKLEEKLSLGVFLTVIVCWMMPGISGGVLPHISAYFDRMGFAVPAIVGSCLLCIIKVKGQPLMTFQQWMKGVEWGTVPLVAAIMVLGVALGKPETGIPELLTSTFKPLVTDVPFHVFLSITLLWVILQTNVMSNMLSMTLVYNIMVPVAASARVGNPAALGVTIAAASSYAFILPSATISTALAVGSGWVSTSYMARYGAYMIIPTLFIFTFICYPIASLILG